MYCIYRITNKLNGKTYIGQHKYKDLSQDKYMGSGKYILRAISKYGIENFEREILISEVETQEEINELEIKYIELERSYGKSEYNISDGGGAWNLSGTNHPIYGKILIHNSEGESRYISKDSIIPDGFIEGSSDDHKILMSKVNKGKSRSNEFKVKQSIIHKGSKWVHNDKGDELYIYKDEPIPDGFIEGRNELVRSKLNEANKNRLGNKNPTHGTRRVHNSEGMERCIPKDAPLPEGFMEGRSEINISKMSESLKGRLFSEETRIKLSKARKGKSLTEGAKCKLSKSRKKLTGSKYYNNGIECHMYTPGTEPKGYTLGKLTR